MRNVVTLEKSALDGPLPFGDESVDVMRAAHVLHLSGNPDALMTDIWKALRPGGALVFSAPVEAKARLLCYADEEYAEGGPRFEVEELREADGVVLAVFSKHGAEPSRKSAVPDRLLALYRRHLAEGGFGEAGDVSVSHVASTAGGDLYRVKDGYGEWYFAIQGQQARWLAQKMPDVQAYDVAPELSELFSKDAVEALGMGDAAWDEALAGYLRKYSPDQPRLEVGPNAGQWIEYPSQENAAVLRSAADRLNRIGGAAGSYKTAQAALVAQLGEKQAKAVLQQFARVCGSNHADRVRREVDRRLHGESVEDLHKEGIEGLVGLLENAPVSRQTLYRGMRFDAKQYAEFRQRYQEGTEFDLGMSSFSSSQAVARQFASGASGGQVIVRTEGKVKALRVEGVSAMPNEKEWLAIGRFKVTSVKTTGRVTTITVRQTAGIKAPPKESLKPYVPPWARTGRSGRQDDEEMPSVSTKEMEFEPAEFWRLFAEMRALPQEKAAVTEFTGAVVMLKVPEEVAKELALPEESGVEGQPPETLHVTLAYLGEASELSSEQVHDIDRVLAEVAAGVRPIEATIGGVGRFSATGDDKQDAFYASVDAPALLDFRAEVVRALSDAGVEANATHGFTPHITLAYLDKDQELPAHRLEPLKATFDTLVLGLAGKETEYPLAIKKYSPNQPRLEVGPNAGQWIEYPSQENAAVLRAAADRLNRTGAGADAHKTVEAALASQLGETQAMAVMRQFTLICASNNAALVRREVDRRLHGKSVEDLHKEGVEVLVGLLENAPVSRQTLYRGMGLDAKQYAEFQQRYQEGTEFDMGMSSFSSSQEIARAFATINSVHRVGGGQVIVQTEGKVKALRVEGVSPWTKEKEWLAIGRFKVTSVKSAGNVTTITIRQTAGIKAPPKESLKSYVRPLLRTGRSKVQDDEEMPSVSTKEMEFEPAKFWRLFAEMRVSPQELGMPAKATKHADVSDADVRVGKPYAGPGDDKLPEWVQKLPEEKRKQWVAVWNDVYAQALKDGMNQREAEGKAFRVASGVVKSEYRVFKAEEERRFTLGIVYSPDEEDAHGDMMTPDEVEAMAWRALAALAHGGMRVGLEHQVFEVKGEAPGMLVESYIYRGPDTVMNGVPVKTGTWIAGVIWHPLLWEQVKSGEIRGFSWAGLAHRE